MTEPDKEEKPTLKVLFEEAQKHLRDDEVDIGLQKAEEAHTSFVNAGDSVGSAEAFYQVCLGNALKGKRAHAIELAQNKLQEFRESKNHFGEAYMLYAIAWLSCDNDEEASRQIACESAANARDLFRGMGDKSMEAASLLVLTDLEIKSEGELEVKVQTALNLAGGALLLYRGIGDKRGEANALHWLAHAQHWLRKPEAVKTSFEAADLFKEIGDELFAAEELQQLAEWETRNNGNLDEAIRAAGDALVLLRQRRGVNTNREIQTLRVLCSAHIAQDQNAEAVRLCQEGIERFKTAEDKEATAATLMILVQAHLNNFKTDESEEALKLAKEAHSACKEVEDNQSAAKVSGLLSLISLRRGSLDQARAYAKACLAGEDIDTLAKGVALQVLVACCLIEKKLDDALQYAEEARTTMHEQPLREGITLMTLCNVHFQMEGLKKAMQCAREAEAIFFECENKSWEAESHQTQAEIHQALSEHQAAVRCAEKAANIWFSMNDGGSMAYSLVVAAQNQSLLVAKLQDLDKGSDNPRTIEINANKRKALRMSTRAKEQAKQVGAERTLASALCALSQAEVFQGKYNAALDATKEAMAICRKLGDQKLLANTLILSARARIVAGWVDEAPDEAAEALTIFRASGDAKGELLVLSLLKEIEEQEDGSRRRFVRPAEQNVLEPKQEDTAAAPVPAAPSTGLDSAHVMQTIQDVTKKLVGGTRDLDEDKPLMEAGVTSMTAILYRSNLASALEGINFPVTLVFDYPTVGAIADMVLEQGARLGGSSYPGAM